MFIDVDKVDPLSTGLQYKRNFGVMIPTFFSSLTAVLQPKPLVIKKDSFLTKSSSWLPQEWGQRQCHLELAHSLLHASEK